MHGPYCHISFLYEEMRKNWMGTMGEYVSELLHVRAGGEDSVLPDDHAERWPPASLRSISSKLHSGENS